MVDRRGGGLRRRYPGRLLAAAEIGGAARKTCQLSASGWPGLEDVAPEPLACVDRGDLDAAIEALQRGREAGWTSLAETHCGEAELYANEAAENGLQRRHRNTICLRARNEVLGEGFRRPELDGKSTCISTITAGIH
jgi:hypothetical protein